MRILVLVLILSNLLFNVASFTSIAPLVRYDVVNSASCLPINSNNKHSRRRRPSPMLLSREEEIAKLESQLRQLRETDEARINDTVVVVEEEKIESDVMDPEDVKILKDFDAARRRLKKVRGKDMLLTEQELIKGGLLTNNGSSGGLGGAIPAIVAVVAAFVGLIIFSQIPVGQEDLARYSATGSSTIKSIDLGDLNPDVNRL